MKYSNLLGLVCLLLTLNACTKTPGCTDAFADNYDPKANEDNGTCAYSGTLIFWCSTDRKLELETNGYVSPASIFINGEVISQLDYASHHLSVTPSCTEELSTSVANNVLSYNRLMSEYEEVVLVEIKDNKGDKIVSYNPFSLDNGTCRSIKL